jgi:protein-S-isoprenylcysteine O-methyltransferase Ste14
MALPDTLAILFAFAVREALHYVIMRGRLRGAASGGRLSVYVWNGCYFALIGLVAWRLTRGPLGPLAWAGYALLWAGILFRTAAFLALRRFYSVFIVLTDDHRLITTGPYRLFRHPLHLGLVVEMLALALMAGTPWAAGPVAVAAAVLVGRNVVEERALVARFGDAYRAYATSAVDVIDLLPERWRA